MISNYMKNNKKPNIIWIFGDQHRAQALGCNGDPNVNTPNIDNLAISGINFTNALSGFPLCCPARGSFLTGRYPHNCVPFHEHRLPEGQPTIADEFNEAGYETAYFGKWHLDGFQESQGRAAFHIIPAERRGGFQRWIGYENNNSQFDSWVHGGEEENAFHYRLPGYETDELTNLFMEFIDEQGQKKKDRQDRPFFAALSVQPPHDPYLAPGNFRGEFNKTNIKLRQNVPNISRIETRVREDLAGYYAMIENLDWNIERIQNTLWKNGLAEETHIMFFSDHGDMHGSHGQFKKTSPFEESIRVPFIISGEQSFYDRETGKSDVLMNHVDVAPTTLGLCGIDKPTWMEGTDYSSRRLHFRKQDKEPDSAYLQLLSPTQEVDKPWRGVVSNDGWKYVCFEGIPWLMFDLNEDPYEQVNLAHNSIYTKERKRLNDQLGEWIVDTGDTFDLPKLS